MNLTAYIFSYLLNVLNSSAVFLETKRYVLLNGSFPFHELLFIKAVLIDVLRVQLNWLEFVIYVYINTYLYITYSSGWNE